MSHAFEITGSGGPITALPFSPDGKTIAAADDSCDLTLWDRNQRETTRQAD